MRALGAGEGVQSSSLPAKPWPAHPLPEAKVKRINLVVGSGQESGTLAASTVTSIAKFAPAETSPRFLHPSSAGHVGGEPPGAHVRGCPQSYGQPRRPDGLHRPSTAVRAARSSRRRPFFRFRPEFFRFQPNISESQPDCPASFLLQPLVRGLVPGEDSLRAPKQLIHRAENQQKIASTIISTNSSLGKVGTSEEVKAPSRLSPV